MLAWDESMAALSQLRAELVASTADSKDHVVGKVVTLVENFGAEVRTLPELLRLTRSSRRLQRQIVEMLEQSDLSPRSQKIAAEKLFAQLRLRQGIETTAIAHRMFRYWHLFHRPLAGTMYIIVLFHVTTALLFGGSLQALSELMR
jgi:hypothetical protein